MQKAEKSNHDANQKKSNPKKFNVVRVPSLRRTSRAGRRQSVPSDDPRQSHDKVAIPSEEYPDDGKHNSMTSSQHTTSNNQRASIFSYRRGSTDLLRRGSAVSEASLGSNKTYGKDSHEALPHVDHYRNLLTAMTNIKSRPTLYELHEEQTKSMKLGNGKVTYEDPEKAAAKPTGGQKFGWIQGVLVRCLLNIFGVMLFLRLTWITGQAGVGLASVIILLSAVVTVITSLSMSAICTNGVVRGGGAYYLISRSLGPEFGGSIGVIFSLANAVAAAMYVVGFAETVRDLMKEFGVSITGDDMNEVRLIGCLTAILLLAIVIIGMEWEAKAQVVLLVILSVAILNYFIGTFIPPTDDKVIRGVAGYRSEVFAENFGPDFRGESFFSVFSIFFPAATGILAGANISGDLKDPQGAIPKGTLLAILITTIVYLAMVWTSGGCLIRDALGPAIFGNLSLQVNVTDLIPDLNDVQNCTLVPCEFGMMNDNAVVGIVSAFRPLILAGIFSATLSSALASLVGAPKVFQALAKDKLYPFIEYFAKGFGRSGEPRRAYVLACFICLGVVCIGDLNAIAPIISNFFLMAYALINFSCFDASLAKSPGFRPAFHFYNKWLSLLGALLCLAVMFLINWWAALVTFVFNGALYLYIRHKKPDVNWGSSGQAHAYTDALKTSLKLVGVSEHIKNFRPQVLVLSGYPSNRPALVDFVYALTKKQSLMSCGHVFVGDLSQHANHLRSMSAYDWFTEQKIKAFYNSVAASDLRMGAQALMQTLGMGKLRPNTLMMGFKSNWQTDTHSSVSDYFNIIHDAFDLNFGVGILRLSSGFDINKLSDDHVEAADRVSVHSSDEEDEDDEMETNLGVEETIVEMDDENETSNDNINQNNINEVKITNINTNQDDLQELSVPSLLESMPNLFDVHSGQDNLAFSSDITRNSLKSESKIELHDIIHKQVSGTKSYESAKSGNSVKSTATIAENDPRVTMFRSKQTGTIDVWWLFDDGGLTLLIPYILSTRKQWRGCKLRVFCASGRLENLDEHQMRMATLLTKFRIEYSQITVVPNIKARPRTSSCKEFEDTISSWRLREGESPEKCPWKITDADLLAHKQKTYRYIRLREVLLEHSKDASLVVMTLPMPRKGTCSTGLYMGWLDTLTRAMPPILLLRGNQQSVLTYYS